VAAKFSQRGVTLQLGDARGATETGDPFLLHQAIVNLLDNAADFAPRGSTVDVSIDRTGPRCTIAVADRGPGVPEFALPRAFERFYSLPRPDGGSRSSGLGLCFVAEVAALHGGEATLENREGGGAVARLALPA
jgi:two-component system sensor histidine kinase CreC